MTWNDAPVGAMRLARGQIHIWRASLSQPPEAQARLAGLLSDEEAGRAARFACPGLRARSQAARGILRDILGRYLRCPPATLVLTTRPGGKPRLAASPLAAVEFNVSHSHDVALFGLVLGADIGVDVERVRAGLHHDAVARRFFSPQERAALEALPPVARGEAFFRYWTCKEAYLKATGEGLRRPLSDFEIRFLPEAAPAIYASGAVLPWTLAEIRPVDGYFGAVAVAGLGYTLSCYQWRIQP